MKCPDCGITVPNMPEDSTHDEQLCNLCWPVWEFESYYGKLDDIKKDKKEKEK
jgi:hypothetical protein